MTLKVDKYKQWLSKQQIKRDEWEKELQNSKDTQLGLERDLVKHEQALEIIKQVALDTQRSLQYHISEITSLALSSVFENPYNLLVEFEEKRNKTECFLSFAKDGYKIHPMSASGGGAVDIASFALRVASWCMEFPRTRPIMILDEPMKNLSKKYQDKSSAMIKELSEKLGIQFIIVTHNEILANNADRIFQVKKGKDGISAVETIK